MPHEHGRATGRTGTGPTWASSTSSSWSRATTTGRPLRAALGPALRALVPRATAAATAQTELYCTSAAARRPARAQTWHSALPAAWHNSTWVGDRTIDFLTSTATEPSALWASFPDPHHPFDAPEPWSRLHDPDDVDLPPHRTLDLERRPWWHRASLEGTPQHRARGLRKFREEYSRIPPQSDDQLAQMIANYYGMISLIDHNVGRILHRARATSAWRRARSSSTRPTTATGSATTG